MSTRVIQVKCPNCAAVLQAPAGAGSVLCEYCHTRSLVQRRTLLQLPARMPATPPGGQIARQVVSRIALVTVAVAVLGPLLLVGVIGLFVWKQVRAATDMAREVPGMVAAATGGTSGSGATMSWLGMGPPVLQDVDGDAVLDAVGLVRYVLAGDVCHLAALSGATGARLWQSPPLGTYNEVYTGQVFAAGDAILFATAGRLDRFAAADGAKGWSLQVQDKVEALCRLDGDRVAVELANQAWQEVSLVDGAARPSPGVERCERLPSSDPRRGDPRATIEDTRGRGSIPGMRASAQLRPAGAPWRLVIGVRSSGTSVPMLARLDGKRTVWSVDLPVDGALEASPSGPDLLAASDTAACAAYQVQGRSQAHLTCFDLGTGERRWDVEVPQTTPLRGLALGGDRVYLSGWGALQVFDAGTGAHLRTIGSR